MQNENKETVQVAHKNMILKQIREQFMLEETVLEAIKCVPRHHFVPEQYHQVAYAETNIPIGHNETMMTPNEEARMLGALNIKPTDKILEIGTGSGYITALLAKLGHTVTSLDIQQDFIESAQKILQAHELHNVKLVHDNGVNGYPSAKSFDVICFTGGLYYLNACVFDQLRTHGRLFAILGKQPSMEATLITKDSHNALHHTRLFETNLAYLKNIPEPNRFEF